MPQLRLTIGHLASAQCNDIHAGGDSGAVAGDQILLLGGHRANRVAVGGHPRKDVGFDGSAFAMPTLENPTENAQGGQGAANIKMC